MSAMQFEAKVRSRAHSQESVHIDGASGNVTSGGDSDSRLPKPIVATTTGPGLGYSYTVEGALMEIGSGCYLIADEMDQGTLYTHWSKAAVAGALAFFTPEKEVPEFKFKSSQAKRALQKQVCQHAPHTGQTRHLVVLVDCSVRA